MEKETQEIKPEQEIEKPLPEGAENEAEDRLEEQPYEEEEPKPKKKSRRKKKRRELTKEQIEVLEDAFNLFDKDGNHEIDKYELKEIMRALGFNPTPDEVDQMIKEVDEDGSGKIELDEFIHMMEKKLLQERDIKEEIKKAFKFFIELTQDENDDSEEPPDNINLERLKKVAEVLGEVNIDEGLFQKMIEVADRDNDGVVHIDDFMRIMRKMKLF